MPVAGREACKLRGNRLHRTTDPRDNAPSKHAVAAADDAMGVRSSVLDGVRGVAILLVLFYHVVDFSGLEQSNLIDRALHSVGSAGWLGVDLFFVLSGFLITGILYEAKGSARYFTSFYGRRVLRIFPLYYGFLAFILVVAPLVLAPDVAADLRAKQGWYWAYLSNVEVALHDWSEPSYLGHFWSLAIEEQFYLIWPWIVLACDRRRLMLVCAGCFLIALAMRTTVPHAMEPVAAYVLLPTRMDTLATGAFVALLMRGSDGREWLRRWAPVVLVVGVSWLGMLFLVRGGLDPGDRIVQTLGYSVIAISCGALIATAVQGTTFDWLQRALCAAPLLFFGKYSYGLYVVHQPIMVGLAEYGLQVDVIPSLHGSALPGVLAFGFASVALCIAAALVTWHVWEAPFLSLKRHLPYRARIPPQPSPGIEKAAQR
jgi:peptidoglycan/LPS O-acetylase OafA/YrhL